MVWFGDEKYCPKDSTMAPFLKGDLFKLPEMNKNITRIAFVGDSITEGYGAFINDTNLKFGKQGYTTDGAKFGNLGFPYILS